MQRRVNRRSFLVRVTAGAFGLTGAAALIVGTPAHAIADQDGTDRSERVQTGPTGVTDRDPTDRVNYGNGGGGGAVSVTDRDPTDVAGLGRGPARNRRTGVTDRDSSDRRCWGRNPRFRTGGAPERC